MAWFYQNVRIETCESFLNISLFASWASPVAQTVKRLSAMQETWVQSLSWEGPLEKKMAAHFSILAWKIPRTAESGRLLSMGSKRVGTRLSDFTFTFKASISMSY